MNSSLRGQIETEKNLIEREIGVPVRCKQRIIIVFIYHGKVDRTHWETGRNKTRDTLP